MASSDDCKPGLEIVKEGWLLKRGEHIKNWRQRYFVLLDNGSLLGFKTQPNQDLSDPLNDFTVKDCQILKTEKPRPYTFIIRGLHRAVIERTFNAESESERKSWIKAIEQVSGRTSPTLSQDFEIEVSESDDGNGTKQVSCGSEDKESHPSSASPRSKITLDNFEFLKVLGKGSFGKVMLCREKSNNLFCAIKIIQKDEIRERGETEHVQTENHVLQKVNHPFLTYLKYSFQTSDKLCFVMEYVNGGELFFHLKQEGRFPEERSRFYGAEICLALEYLHANNIIYRDLKLENVLLDAEGHIKIVDFGLCKEDMAYGSTTKTFCGTPEYFAPEVLEENEYGRSVDWWGYGVCLYEMMVGRLPFYDRDTDNLFYLIVCEDVNCPKTLSSEAKDLLEGLLCKDPNKRLGGGQGDAKEVQNHPFFVTINWKLLLEKKILPPFKPLVTSESDTRYFDQMYGEPVQLTPPDESKVDKESDTIFKNFSYQDLAACPGSSLESGIHSLNVAKEDSG